MKKIVIYLDVDGVLNSLSGRPPKSMTKWVGEWSQEQVQTIGGRFWTILWSNELIDNINKLALQPNVTIKWLTTWEDSASVFLSPALGITEGHNWEVLKDSKESLSPVTEGWTQETSKSWWKLDLIREDVENGDYDAVVWIDDDLKHSREAMSWIRSVEESIGFLPVSPFSTLGVTKREFDDIMEFVGL